MPQRPKKESVLYLRFQTMLQELLDKSEMRQAEAAEKLNVSDSNYISQIKGGFRGVTIEQVEKIAEIFDVDPGVFFAPRERRRHLRLIFDEFPANYRQKLRGTGKDGSLIDRFKGVVHADAEYEERNK